MVKLSNFIYSLSETRRESKLSNNKKVTFVHNKKYSIFLFINGYTK